VLTLTHGTPHAFATLVLTPADAARLATVLLAAAAAVRGDAARWAPPPAEEDA
jgi:hypothetical protein